jgi:hypothetical protein
MILKDIFKIVVATAYTETTKTVVCASLKDLPPLVTSKDVLSPATCPHSYVLLDAPMVIGSTNPATPWHYFSDVRSEAVSLNSHAIVFTGGTHEQRLALLAFSRILPSRIPLTQQSVSTQRFASTQLA